MLDLDENSAKDTGIFIAACDRLKREFHCAVVVIHHSGKDDRKGARGSSNLPASFDTRFKVVGDTDTLIATIKNEKQRDGEPWSSVITFQGERVRLDDGHRSLVFGRVPPGSKSEPSANEKRALLRCGRRWARLAARPGSSRPSGWPKKLCARI